MPGDVAGDGARGDPVRDGYGAAVALQALNARAPQALNARAAPWVVAGLCLHRHLHGQRQRHPG